MELSFDPVPVSAVCSKADIPVPSKFLIKEKFPCQSALEIEWDSWAVSLRM